MYGLRMWYETMLKKTGVTITPITPIGTSVTCSSGGGGGKDVIRGYGIIEYLDGEKLQQLIAKQMNDRL